MRLDLESLSFHPAGQHLDIRPDFWLRATILIAGIEHFVDLVGVKGDRSGEQRAHSKELDAMLGLHHLACGADGPFSTVRLGSHAYVLFVTPYCD